MTGILTVCLTCLPLLGMYFTQACRYRELSETVAAYEAKERAFSSTTVMVLSQPVSAGEQITADKLTSCTIQLPQASDMVFVTDRTALDGSYAKTALKKGSILSPDMVYSDKTLEEKMRTIELTTPRFPEQLRDTDLVEIRLFFPNGEDFVVLNHQKPQRVLRSDNGIYGILLALSEDELLRLSSAQVDTARYPGAYLYTVVCRTDFETASSTDYPVNADVFSLMQWDPNIISRLSLPKEVEKRELLETHLQNFLQTEPSTDIEWEENYNISQP